jgi:hypothetical protein
MFDLQSGLERPLPDLCALQGETVVVASSDPKHPKPGFYGVALSPTGVEAKVKVGAEGVHEYGREELDP